MSVKSLWHAGFTVDDIERSIAFWTEAVGMVLRHRQIQENELIEYQRPAGQRIEPDNARIGSGHIALEVDDIDSTRERCERMGATFLSHTLDITEGINRGGRAVYGRAPDGITFELVQPPKIPGTPSSTAPA